MDFGSSVIAPIMLGFIAYQPEVPLLVPLHASGFPQQPEFSVYQYIIYEQGHGIICCLREMMKEMVEHTGPGMMMNSS